jgi:hypothetical protein
VQQCGTLTPKPNNVPTVSVHQCSCISRSSSVKTIHRPFLYGSNGCERYPRYVRDSDGEICKIYRKCTAVCQVSNTFIVCQVTVAEHCRFPVACAKNLEHTDVILYSDITVAAEIYGTNFAQHRRSIKPGRLLTSNHSTTS